MIIAPQHIGHGSRVTYIEQSGSLQPPSLLHAASIAIISAWARAFFEFSRRFRPSPIISPVLFFTTTAPTGTSPSSKASFASSAVAAAEDETVITAVDEINDEADDGIVEDETVEDENAGEQPSLLENDFIRFILDLIDILKSTFRFLEKVFNN